MWSMYTNSPSRILLSQPIYAIHKTTQYNRRHDNEVSKNEKTYTATTESNNASADMLSRRDNEDACDARADMPHLILGE